MPYADLLFLTLIATVHAATCGLVIGLARLGSNP